MTAQFLSLADADDLFFVATDDGARLPVYGLAGPKEAPVLLFGHANGMAAGAYGPWLRRLAAELRVFAFDARGHGGSTFPEGPLDAVFSVDRLADDLALVSEAVCRHAHVERIAVAGHSLGGASALRLLATGRAPPWTHHIIFEPPISPPPAARSHAFAVERQMALVDGTLKRRVRWPSVEDFIGRLRGRGQFARYDPAMLEAHCRATLRPAPDGGFRLACPPAIESAIYLAHWHADTWSRLRSIGARINLVSGDPTLPDNDWVSSALPEMAAQFSNLQFFEIAGAGHLLIGEQTERTARIVLDCVRN